MLELPRDAPASIACGRSGRPLFAICANKHRRLVPFRLLRTSEDDRSPLYGRRFLCRACGGRDVTLFAIESQAELDAIRQEVAEPPGPAPAPTNYGTPDPDADIP